MITNNEAVEVLDTLVRQTWASKCRYCGHGISRSGMPCVVHAGLCLDGLARKADVALEKVRRELIE